MTRTVFEKSIPELVAEVVASEDRHRAAVRLDDITSANRWFERSRTALKELSNQGSEGRTAVEAMMRHPSSFVRLGAAATVHEWAPELAIPVLADLYVGDYEPDASPSERGSINIGAKGLLYRIFGITSYDPDDLIKPLRAYGIAWPSLNEQLKTDAVRRSRLVGKQTREPGR